MKLLIVMSIVLLTLVGVAYWINDPGYVLVRIGEFGAEATLWGSLLALLTVLVLLRLLYVTFRAFWRGSSWVIGWSGQRKTKECQELQQSAVLALVRDDWVAAQEYFLRAKRLGKIGFASNLGLARAAYELGNIEVQTSALDAAKLVSEISHNGAPNDSSRDKGQRIASIAMNWLIDRGEGAQVIDVLEPQYKTGECPNAKLVVLCKAYLHASSATDIKNIWPVLERQKLLKKKFFDKDFEKVWAKRLSAESNTADALKILPKIERANTTILSEWINVLAANGNAGDLVAVIEYALANTWNDEWLQLYGKTHGPDLESQLVYGKKLLKKKPDDVVVLIALGRLATNKRQLTLARDYFEAALGKTQEGDSARAEIYRELGRICNALGDTQRALQYLLKV